MEEGKPTVPVLRVQFPDRRGQMRLCPPVLSAILFTGEDRNVVSIADISFTGAKILNAPPGLRVGDTLQLAACLQEQERMLLLCTIAYVNGNEVQSEVGVRFENVEDADTHVLISYLRQLLDSEVESAGEILAR
jgi:hypothetical protein